MIENSNSAAVDSDDSLEAEVAREVYISESEQHDLVYPPTFSRPTGLTEDGIHAWRTVMQVLSHERLDAEANHQVFFSPNGYPVIEGMRVEDAALMVEHDGGTHATYFNVELGALMHRSAMDRALHDAGFFMETQTPLTTAIFKRQPTEAELHQLREALGGEPGAEEDDFETKDVAEPDNRDARVMQLFSSLGVEVGDISDHPADVCWGDLGKPYMWIRSLAPRDPDKPWTCDPTPGQEVSDLSRRLASGLGDILGTPDVEYQYTFDSRYGKWRFDHMVNNPPDRNKLITWVEESLGNNDDDDFDTKELLWLGDKLDTIKELFQGYGLHISSIDDKVLAHPFRGGESHYHEIIAYLQPEADKPWTIDGTAGPELEKFARHVQGVLSTVLQGLDVEYGTDFDLDLGSWKMTWHVYDPETRNPVAESEDDDADADLIKDVEHKDFRKGDLVRRPLSKEPKRVMRITGGYSKGTDANGEVLWQAETGSDMRPFVVVPASELELVERPVQLENDLVEDSEQGDGNRIGTVAVFRKTVDGYDVLLCQRDVAPEKGGWCLPGGHVKKGETSEAGAHREMEEETGLDLGELTYIKKFHCDVEDLDIYVYGTMLPEEGKPKADDDAAKLKWENVNKLPKLVFDNNALIAEIIESMGLNPHVASESKIITVDRAVLLGEDLMIYGGGRRVAEYRRGA